MLGKEEIDKNWQECKDILESWKGILENYFNKIEGELNIMKPMIEKNNPDLNANFQRINVLVNEMKTLFSNEIAKQKTEVNLSQPKEESLPLKNLFLNYFNGKYTCLCKEGSKFGLLECGHWMCLGCTANYNIRSKLNENFLERMVCKFCSKEISLSIR